MSASPPELSRIWEYFSIRQAQTIKVHHNQRLSGGGKRCKNGNQKAYSERETQEFENTDSIRCQLARSSNPRVSAGQVLARFLGCELFRVPVLGVRKLRVAHLMARLSAGLKSLDLSFAVSELVGERLQCLSVILLYKAMFLLLVREMGNPIVFLYLMHHTVLGCRVIQRHGLNGLSMRTKKQERNSIPFYLKKIARVI